MAHVAGLVDEVRTVSEEELSRALLFCLERAKLVVEPAGVAGVAALLADPAAFRPPVVAVVSGGNIDPVLLLKVVQHGMAAAGRYLSLRVRVRDQPGIAGRAAARSSRRPPRTCWPSSTSGPRHGWTSGEVEVAVVLETQGPDHAREVLADLAAAGYEAVAD